MLKSPTSQKALSPRQTGRACHYKEAVRENEGEAPTSQAHVADFAQLGGALLALSF